MHQAADILKRGQRHEPRISNSETTLRRPAEPERNLPVLQVKIIPPFLLRDLGMKGIGCKAPQPILDISLLRHRNLHPCRTQKDHGFRLCANVPGNVVRRSEAARMIHGPDRFHGYRKYPFDSRSTRQYYEDYVVPPILNS